MHPPSVIVGLFAGSAFLFCSIAFGKTRRFFLSVALIAVAVFVVMELL